VVRATLDTLGPRAMDIPGMGLPPGGAGKATRAGTMEPTWERGATTATQDPMATHTTHMQWGGRATRCMGAKATTSKEARATRCTPTGRANTGERGKEDGMVGRGGRTPTWVTTWVTTWLKGSTATSSLASTEDGSTGKDKLHLFLQSRRLNHGPMWHLQVSLHCLLLQSQSSMSQSLSPRRRSGLPQSLW